MAASDDVIETLVNAYYPEADTQTRPRHMMRETLQSLVRLAQAEQLLAMRARVDVLIHIPVTKH